MDLHTWLVEQVKLTEAEARKTLVDPTPVLRRCEADRNVLDRHNSWAALFSSLSTTAPTRTACHGCGSEGYGGDHVTENLNDCPELLDLAHAHGITPEILDGLDRPEVPKSKQGAAPRLGLGDLLAPRTPTSGVPESLRGPNWRPAG